MRHDRMVSDGRGTIRLLKANHLYLLPEQLACDLLSRALAIELCDVHECSA